MTGLDKMKRQILEEAKAVAESKIEEAKAQAEGIICQANEEAEKLNASIAQKSQTQEANYKDRMTSSADLQRRTKLLSAKQEMIAEVLEKAYTSLTTMGTEEYFQMLLKVLEKHVLPQDGKIFFSKEDFARMPEAFKEKVKQTALAKGGSLAISGEGRNIENGFVIAYGGIEENCTLRAMLDARKGELSDKVHRILFM